MIKLLITTLVLCATLVANATIIGGASFGWKLDFDQVSPSCFWIGSGNPVGGVLSPDK